MDVILDTNIYEANFSLTSARWEALAAYLSKTNDYLVIPYVVEQEVRAHYKDDLKSAVKSLKQAAAVFAEVAIHPSHLDLITKISEIRNRDNAWLDEQSEQYFKFINRKIGNVKTADLPKIDIRPIVDRALRKESPFKSSGVGLKDTVLWESIFSYAQAEKKDSIVFISNNSNDFGKKKLFDHLEAEAKTHNVKIYYYNSVEDFIKEHFDTIRDITVGPENIDIGELQELMETWLKGSNQKIDHLFKTRSTGNILYHNVQGVHNTTITKVEEVIVKDVSPDFKYVHATLDCHTDIVCVGDHYSEYTNRFGDYDYDAYQELDDISTECLVEITMKLSDNNSLFSELEVTDISFP